MQYLVANAFRLSLVVFLSFNNAILASSVSPLPHRRTTMHSEGTSAWGAATGAATETVDDTTAATVWLYIVWLQNWNKKQVRTNSSRKEIIHKCTHQFALS